MRAMVLAGLALMAGCAPQNEVPGHEAFLNYCAACHGVSARGDGPLAADLPVVPADLTMLAAANDGVFPQSRVMAKIHGYPGRYQAQVMPEFGPLLTGPQIMWEDENGVLIPTPRVLLDLAEYLKSIQAG